MNYALNHPVPTGLAVGAEQHPRPIWQYLARPTIHRNPSISYATNNYNNPGFVRPLSGEKAFFSLLSGESQARSNRMEGCFIWSGVADWEMDTKALFFFTLQS